MAHSEHQIEQRLKNKLEAKGFQVLKLVTPGTGGTKDRLILWPKYAPRPPSVVEVKREGEVPRLLQAKVAAEWRARGVDVRRYVDSYAAVDLLVAEMVQEATFIEIERRITDQQTPAISG